MGAFTRLFREGCGGYLCILLWPHWIVGIIFPLLIGITSYSTLAAACLIAVTCVLPYSYWIVKLNCHPDNENENYRTMPCCSCLCKDSHRNNLERSIICKRVIDGGEEDDYDDDVIEVNNIFQSEKEQESGGIASYRSKHPKSDIVKKRKKKSPAKNNINTINTSHSDNEGSGCDGSVKSQQGDASDALSTQQGLSFPVSLSDHQGLSFPVTLPDDNDDDEEMKMPCIRADENSILNDDESTSQSELVCSICLEEYNVGDKIAWSKNDECHHAFHKDCIIEWLVNHQNCPICRKRY